jgi:hypothetical protein
MAAVQISEVGSTLIHCPRKNITFDTATFVQEINLDLPFCLMTINIESMKFGVAT